MKSKLLLSVAAVAVMSSTAFAGNITYGNSPELNVSKEWALSKSAPDVNISLGNITYEPTKIPYQTLTNPVINLTFNNATGVKTDDAKMAKVYVCEVNSTGYPTGEAILKYDSVYQNILIFKALNKDKYITNGKEYSFFYDINESNCSQTSAGAAINTAATLAAAKANSTMTAVTLDKDNLTDVTTHITLATGDSQQEQDTADGTAVVGVKTQFCAGVSTKFDGVIDPTQDFLQFTGGAASSDCLTGSCTETQALSDSVTLTIASDKCKIINNNYQVPNVQTDITISSDKALPLAATGALTATYKYGGNTEVAVNSDNIKNTDNKVFTYSFYDDNNASIGDNNLSTTFTVKLNGDDKIPTAKFKSSVDIITKKLDVEKTFDLLNEADAGSWTYNASSKTIPYVAANSDTETLVRVTNNSGTKGLVFWTCVDDQGNVAPNIEVKAADTGSTEIPANGAAAWTMSSVLKAAQETNPDFATNGKMKCTVYVTNGNAGISVVPIMTINGARDRVIPTE